MQPRSEVFSRDRRRAPLRRTQQLSRGASVWRSAAPRSHRLVRSGGDPLTDPLYSPVWRRSGGPLAERGGPERSRGVPCRDGSAGVKRAQREPRDGRESASGRRGARATVAGAVARPRRPPLPKGLVPVPVLVLVLVPVLPPQSGHPAQQPNPASLARWLARSLAGFPDFTPPFRAL